MSVSNPSHTEHGAETDRADFLLLLHDVARLTRIETDRRARAQGMTRAQWVMLLKLARHPGLSQKDLAELLEVEPMTVARLTDRLAERGLVERRGDPADRRIWRLHLRDQAAPLIQQIQTERAAIAALITRDLPAPMRDVTEQALLQIKRSLAEATQSEAPGHGESPDAANNQSNAFVKIPFTAQPLHSSASEIG
ncbi:MAG TPA: MarR family transcriptional regulator [Acidiphilium sp.]|nr:MAG: hypothetical protein B7Z67_06595 [Acidiphilium sp. 21-60-14]OYV91961.1 MAG: hypothetical protein B7Z57_02505 [Acidiphilium sp. 37-60-79]OZB39177.1 MAG: hypothetical protein B7X48_10150 [Acidiphilium sp. 34-60-192]HQT88386.1 MarR family transcriptional regulator [Acidiphilium sp.]HQU23914.1 MarR family transcriptional regulator [Acidiphilium sp.]